MHVDRDVVGGNPNPRIVAVGERERETVSLKNRQDFPVEKKTTARSARKVQHSIFFWIKFGKKHGKGSITFLLSILRYLGNHKKRF